ncbi:hypothetical protein ASD08_21930, partial [Streptomyces sp. Root369]
MVGFAPGAAGCTGGPLRGSATFVEADQFGPLVCAGRVVLSGAVFGGPVTLSRGRKAGISLLLSATWRWARTWPVWSIAASRVTC